MARTVTVSLPSIWKSATWPGFPAPSMLVSEYVAGSIAAYEMDQQRNPVIASRRLFVGGGLALDRVQGGTVNPATGRTILFPQRTGNRIWAMHIDCIFTDRFNAQ